MKTIRQKAICIIFLVLGWLSTADLYGQVTIGDDNAPLDFSILEISSQSTKGGLRLPHLNTIQRDSLQGTLVFQTYKKTKAKGLTIYNTDTQCLEYWNAKKWISLCTGAADITFKDERGVPTDPTVPAFPSLGGTKGPFIPSDNPNCTEENPAFDFLIITGVEFVTVDIIDASTGKFTISMEANPTAKPRTAVLRIVNNCSKEYKEYLFTQDGDDENCSPTPVPPILSYGSTELCLQGSLQLYIEGHPTVGDFIWTLSGQEIGRGTSINVTSPGRYTVYDGKIGCDNSSSISIGRGTDTAPPSVNYIVVANNGIACGEGGEVDMIVTGSSSGNIVWYKDGQKTTKTGTRIKAGKGKWFAIVEDGDCNSYPTKEVEVFENLDGGSISIPKMKINGAISGWSLCAGGSMYMEVEGMETGITYTWYLNNEEIGKGTGIYHTVPNTEKFVLRLRATGVGCAQESLSLEQLSAGTAPSAPFITANTKDVLCGGKATLTSSNPGGATSYRWFKNGTEVAGETTNTLEVSETGSYTVSAIAGTCASIQSGARTITLSDFATLSWISHPDKANYGEVKTYSVSLQYPDAPLKSVYKWTVTGGGIITNGQGTSSITVVMPSVDATVEVKCAAENGCGNAIGSPQKQSVAVTAGCSDAQITNTSSLDVSIKENKSTTLSVTALGTNITYRWYTGAIGSGTSLNGETNSTYTYTAGNTTGDFLFYCVVTPSGGCQVATSEQFTVTVTRDPSKIPGGAGAFSGKTCFDIAQSNDGTNSCGTLSARADQQTDFSIRTEQDPAAATKAPYTGIQIYTFKPSGTVSNVRFDYIDPSGQVIESLTPKADYSGTISGECKVAVAYRASLNDALKGLTRKTALKADLYAIYSDNAAGNGTEKTVKINLTFQDCACCGAPTVSGGWLSFMCHNLGADESLDPFTYKSDGNTADYDIKGYLYQWGRPADGHEKRSSSLVTTLATTNTPDHANFISATSSPYDWRRGGGETSRWGDGTVNANQKRGDNDPCPPGWKVPSQKQWLSLFHGSKTSGTPADASLRNWTWTGNGYKIGDALYLPAAGYRQPSGGILMSVGTSGEYWSATVSSTNSFDLYFTSKNINVGSTSYRGYAYSVRCVTE